MDEISTPILSAAAPRSSGMNLISLSPLSYQVALIDELGVEFPCVGTILSSYLILTLASCLYGNEENGSTIRTKGIKIGQNSTGHFDFGFEEEEQIRRIIKVIEHPDFKTFNSKNDLALLLLDDDLNLNLNGTSAPKSVPLFPMSNTEETHHDSTFMNFSGFLCEEDSELFPLEISHPLKCSSYSEFKSDKMCLLPANSNSNFNNWSSSEVDCAKPLPGSSLFCSDEESGTFLCGILAESSSENLGGNGRIYTNMTKHLKWIQSASADARNPRLWAMDELTVEEEPDSGEDGEHQRMAKELGLVGTILGGVDADGPISYQLSLQYQEKPPRGPWKPLCGAVVLDKGTAITAAHCVDKSTDVTKFRILAGKKDLNVTGEGEQNLPIKKIILHEKWTGDFLKGNDIAMIHVGGVGFNNSDPNLWLSPIPTYKLTDMTAVISGWGQVSNVEKPSNTLQTANVSIMNVTACLNLLKTSKTKIKKGVVCTSSRTARTCGGDSGGPLVIQNYPVGNSVRNLLVGVSSFAGKFCERTDGYAAFTAINQFYRWIKENRAAEEPRSGEVGKLLPCFNSTRKFKEAWECDGEWDCPDGSDEVNCNAHENEPIPNQQSSKIFGTLNLPHSVMKLESLDLQVNIHNNLGRNVSVFVTLVSQPSNFTIVDGKGTRRITAVRNNVTTAHFVITPMVIGDIRIEVRVVTEDGSSANSIRGLLKVKSDGVQQSWNQLFMFRKPSKRHVNLSRETNFELKFPSKRITGGNAVQLTVVGDPMSTMTSNLGHLLPLPVASGEQNMMPFVSSLLTLQYMSAINSTTKNLVQTAKRVLHLSFKRQLEYQNRDGSFSVWKKEAGSTWLTAFVLRWFVAAQKHITIRQVVNKAINFIKGQQQKDGSFFETGALYHPRMGGRLALTAYITLALIKANETSNNNWNLKEAIENGMNFISQESVYQLDDNYITNLVAATLMAGNHPEKTRFFEKMESRANTSTTKLGLNAKCWDAINTRQRASGPLAIEMTSYALLAHLWKEGPKSSSVHYVYNWLLKQQNPQGGFISTQDTVLGLTALTEYALKKTESSPSQNELQLNIRASSNSSVVNDTEFSVPVAPENRMVLQEFPLPLSTKVVHVRARGSGTALIQMTQSWHLSIIKMNSKISQQYFNISAAMRIPDPEEPSETELEFCVNSLNSNGTRDSVASVQLPSGYAFSPQDYEGGSDFLSRRPKNVKRFDLTEGKTKMDVYYNEIPRHPPTCLTFSAERVHEVSGTKKRPIVVYEYSNPENKAVISYDSPHKMSICKLCASTGACVKEGCTT